MWERREEERERKNENLQKGLSIEAYNLAKSPILAKFFGFAGLFGVSAKDLQIL